MAKASLKKSEKMAGRHPSGRKPAVATVSPAPARLFGGEPRVFCSSATTALGTVAGGIMLRARANER